MIMLSCNHENPEPGCACWFKPDNCHGINCNGCPKCCSDDCATCAIKGNGKSHLTIKCILETSDGKIQGDALIRSCHSNLHHKNMKLCNKNVELCLVLDGFEGNNITIQAKQILLENGSPNYRISDFDLLTKRFEDNFDIEVLRYFYWPSESLNKKIELKNQ